MSDPSVEAQLATLVAHGENAAKTLTRIEGKLDSTERRVTKVETKQGFFTAGGTLLSTAVAFLLFR